MDVATIISKDNCCDLGKWLHGEAKIKFAKVPSYTECLTKHATFHTEAISLLNAGTPYSAASNAVGNAILRLKKDAAL